MDSSGHKERRGQERRFVERRRARVPVFLETRRPAERREAQRRQ